MSKTIFISLPVADLPASTDRDGHLWAAFWVDPAATPA